MLLPSFHTLPPAYQRAKSYHLGIHPERPPFALLEAIREACPTGKYRLGSSPLPVIYQKLRCAPLYLRAGWVGGAALPPRTAWPHKEWRIHVI